MIERVEIRVHKLNYVLKKGIGRNVILLIEGHGTGKTIIEHQI